MKVKWLFLLSAIQAIFLSACFSQNVGNPDSLLRLLHTAKEDTAKVSVLIQLGEFYSDSDTSTAFEYYRQAAGLSRKLKNIKLEASCEMKIAALYSRYRNAENAIRYYISSSEKFKVAGDYLNAGTACDELAKQYFFVGRYDLAVESANQSIGIFKDLKDTLRLASSMNNAGIMYKEKGDYITAMDYFKKSLSVKKMLGDKKGMIMSYNNMGNVYDNQGNYSRSVEVYLEALLIADETDDLKARKMLLNNLGVVYMNQGNSATALDYYNKALEICEKLDDRYGICDALNNISLIYKTDGNYQEAYRYQMRCLKIKEELNYKINYSYHNLGNIYKHLGKADSAIILFEKSLKMSEETGSKPAVASVCLSIGSFYGERKQSGPAMKYYLKAIEIASEAGLPDVVKDAAGNLQSLYAEAGNFKKAYEYHVLFKQMSDSLLNESNIKSIAQLEMQYTFDRKQQETEFEQQKKELEHQAELVEKEAKIKRERLLRNVFILGFLLILVLAFLILRSYLLKKKANRLLKEKNEEIQAQRDEIAAQKDLLQEQKEHIEEMHDELKDSIRYAKRIQTAVIPEPALLEDIMGDHFVMFRPRDIVSGDFYWATKIDGKTVFCAADCTGHGVPGAFMSMLGISLLNEIVAKNRQTDPGIILGELRKGIISSLKQKGEEVDTIGVKTGSGSFESSVKDGMDITLCSLDRKLNSLFFAGANNSLYMIRNNELSEIKGAKMPVAIHERMGEYETHQIITGEKDTFYIFSDGFADQFGGPTEGGKKYKYSTFKNFLLSVQDKEMAEQKLLLEQEFENWKGNHEQVDDVLIIGIKI
ncbi:MAG: tetratricopeptide repeat protein [Bacteroidota bacterium]